MYPTPTKKRMKLRFFGANIKANPLMSMAKVGHDYGLLRLLAGNGGLEECQPKNYKAKLRRIFPVGQFYIGNLDREIPLVLNSTRFLVTDSTSYRSMRGLFGISPNRYTGITKSLTHVKYMKGFKVAFLVEHRVSGVLSRKAPLFYRISGTRKHQALNVKLVQELVNEGYLIIGTGDVNLVNIAPYHFKQHWVHNKGIDKMWFIESKTLGLDVTDKRIITDHETFYATDHPILFMEGWIYEK